MFFRAIAVGDPGAQWRVPVLVPDLPRAHELLPWLQRIDDARRYANFGPLVREFESLLAQGWASGAGVPEVVTLSSGTAALELALSAMSIEAPGQVLMPSFTFAATAGVAVRRGLQPVFCDVATDTWQLTPHLARIHAKRHKLALIMPVASLGCPVDVAAWDDFVAETGIPVLIDAAAGFGNQGIGLRVHVAFSFHATKPFGVGEGGALVTRDAELAARVRRLSNFGFDNHWVTEVGTNAKLSEYAAAVGLAQLTRWPQRQARRRSLWRGYRAELGAMEGVRLQQGYGVHGLPATLMLWLPTSAQTVALGMARMGIQTRRWYGPPLHQHRAFAGFPCMGEDGQTRLPVTEMLADCALGLPWFGAMATSQCAEVAAKLRQALVLACGDAWTPMGVLSQ